jgi:hypothetical protein
MTHDTSGQNGHHFVACGGWEVLALFIIHVLIEHGEV